MFGKALRELVHVGDTAGFKNFFLGRIRTREGDILADRSIKQERILQHHA
jgi:hypothetical protein